MPSKAIRDEGIWEKAKKAAGKGNEEKYALVMDIYKKMGGKLSHKTTKADDEVDVLERLLRKADPTDDLADILKAKYTRRWKGSDGKWRYEYGKGNGKSSAKEAEATTAASESSKSESDGAEATTNNFKMSENNVYVRAAQKLTDNQKDDLDELILYAENDGDLYRQMVQPMMKNLEKKLRNGTYDANLAPKMWMHLLDAASKKYAKELERTTGHSFPPVVRQAAALEYAKNMLETIKEDMEYRESKAKKQANKAIEPWQLNLMKADLRL